jgi:hypothetical protein
MSGSGTEMLRRALLATLGVALFGGSAFIVALTFSVGSPGLAIGVIGVGLVLFFAGRALINWIFLRS